MNIVITGCSKGIGAELVKIWTKEHIVYGLSRDADRLERLKLELDCPSNFNYLSSDVITLNSDKIKSWIKAEKIDILVNNAGFLINRPFLDITYQDYKSVMDTNFWGAFRITQLLAKKLSTAAGQVINISSMGGVNFSSKFSGLSLYSSSKGALTILTECLAEELKPYKIRVNTLALGAVQTEMLEEAFPEYKADMSSAQMAMYIIRFANSVDNILNGQIIRATSSNP